MNERFRELLLQARKETNAELGFFSYKAEERFAELIIQDCYVALFPALRDMISRGQAYDLIKEHFGVK